MMDGDCFFQSPLIRNRTTKLYKVLIHLYAVDMPRWPYPGCEFERRKPRSTTQINDNFSRLNSSRFEQRPCSLGPVEHLLVTLKALRLDLRPVVP